MSLGRDNSDATPHILRPKVLGVTGVDGGLSVFQASFTSSKANLLFNRQAMHRREEFLVARDYAKLWDSTRLHRAGDLDVKEYFPCCYYKHDLVMDEDEDSPLYQSRRLNHLYHANLSQVPHSKRRRLSRQQEDREYNPIHFGYNSGMRSVDNAIFLKQMWKRRHHLINELAALDDACSPTTPLVDSGLKIPFRMTSRLVKLRDFPSDWKVKKHDARRYSMISPTGQRFRSIQLAHAFLKNSQGLSNNTTKIKKASKGTTSNGDTHKEGDTTEEKTPQQVTPNKPSKKRTPKKNKMPVSPDKGPSSASPLSTMWTEEGAPTLLGLDPVWDDTKFTLEEEDCVEEVIQANRQRLRNELQRLRTRVRATANNQIFNGRKSPKNEEHSSHSEKTQGNSEIQSESAGSASSAINNESQSENFKLNQLDSSVSDPSRDGGIRDSAIASMTEDQHENVEVATQRASSRIRKSVSHGRHGGRDAGAALPSAFHAHALVTPKLYGLVAPPSSLPREDEPPPQPFEVVVHPTVSFIADLHAHCAKVEIIGLLGGKWIAADDRKFATDQNGRPQKASRPNSILYVQTCLPCTASSSGSTDVEIDPISMTQAQEAISAHGLVVVGWYHSHPTFEANPSATDLINQANFQVLFRDSFGIGANGQVEPFVGLIVRPPPLLLDEGKGSCQHVKKKSSGAHGSSTESLERRNVKVSGSDTKSLFASTHTWFHVHREPTTYSSKAHSLVRMGYSGITLPESQEAAFGMLLRVQTRVSRGSNLDVTLSKEKDQFAFLFSKEEKVQTLSSSGNMIHSIVEPTGESSPHSSSSMVDTTETPKDTAHSQESLVVPDVFLQYGKKMKDSLTCFRSRMHSADIPCEIQMTVCPADSTKSQKDNSTGEMIGEVYQPAIVCVTCDQFIVGAQQLSEEQWKHSCTAMDTWGDPVNFFILQLLERHMVSPVHCYLSRFCPKTYHLQHMHSIHSEETSPPQQSGLNRVKSSSSTICVCRQPLLKKVASLSTGSVSRCSLRLGDCSGYFHPDCCQGGYCRRVETDQEVGGQVLLSCSNCVRAWNKSNPRDEWIPVFSRKQGDSCRGFRVVKNMANREQNATNIPIPHISFVGLQSTNESLPKPKEPQHLVTMHSIQERPGMLGLFSQVQGILECYSKWPEKRRTNFLRPLPLHALYGGSSSTLVLGEDIYSGKTLDACDIMRLSIAHHMSKFEICSTSEGKTELESGLLDFICRTVRFLWSEKVPSDRDLSNTS